MGRPRDHGSRGSIGPSGNAAAGVAAVSAARTVAAVSTSRVNTETQSSDRHAGTTPAALSRPRVGLSPTMPLKAAGTRPEPAVSVPRATSTSPRATATADPELEPPLTRSGSATERGAP